MGKIKVSDFVNSSQGYKDVTYTDKWNGLDIEITKVIGMREMMGFVINVVEGCFTSDETYLPELKDYNIKENIILYYTNIELPDEVVDKYDLLYATDIVDFVVERINKSQIKEIVRSIDKKIEHRAAANIEMVYKQVNDLYVQMNDLFEKIGGAFEGVTQEEISNVMKALADGKMDEAAIVRALFEQQYTKE